MSDYNKFSADDYFIKVGEWCATPFWLAKTWIVKSIGVNDSYIQANLNCPDDFIRLSANSFIDFNPANIKEGAKPIVDQVQPFDIYDISNLLPTSHPPVPLYYSGVYYSTLADDGPTRLANDLALLSFVPDTPELEEYQGTSYYPRFYNGCIAVLRSSIEPISSFRLSLTVSSSPHILCMDNKWNICAIISPYYTRGFVPQVIDMLLDSILRGRLVIDE